MSIVRRILASIALCAFTAAYFTIPFAAAYLFVVIIFSGSKSTVPVVGSALLLGMIFLGPSVLISVATAFGLQRFAAAVGFLFARIALGPDFRLAAASMAADIYRRRGNIDIAQDLADRGRREWPKVRNPRVSIQYYAVCCNVNGDIYFQRYMLQEALNSYYEPVALQAASGAVRTAAYLNCAAVMNAMGHFRESLEYIDYAKGLNPNPHMSTVLNSHAAMAFVELDRKSEAREAADRALSTARGPMSTAQANVVSAWVWLAMGEYDRAREVLPRAKEALEDKHIPPLVKTAFQTRTCVVEARLLELDGRVDEAIALLNQALEHSPKAPSIMDALAKLYDRLGRVDDARTWRDRIVREVPRSGVAKRIVAGATLAP